MSATSLDVITHLIIVSYVSDGLYLQRIGTALARKVYRRGKLSNSIRVGGEKIKINKSVAAPITILAGMATPVWAEHNIEPYGHIGNLAHEVHYAVHELSGEVTTHLCTDSETEYVLSDLRGVERYASDIERLAHHRVDRRVLSDSIHHLEFVFRHVKYSLKHSDHDLFFQRTSHAYGGGHVVHISEVLYFLDKYIYRPLGCGCAQTAARPPNLPSLAWIEPPRRRTWVTGCGPSPSAGAISRFTFERIPVTVGEVTASSTEASHINEL